MRSFDEARNTLHLADKLGLRAPTQHANDPLVFPCLTRRPSPTSSAPYSDR